MKQRKKLSKKTIEKIRLKLLGHKVTKETRTKIRLANEGHIVTKETRKKISEAHKGKPTWNKGLTKETDERIKEYYSKPPSEETKRKMSEAKLGKIFSKEHIMNLRKSHLGYKHSENQKNKISNSIKGEKHPNWLGGKSFEPYGIEFNNTLKKAIKERDSCCMICKIWFEDLKLLKRRVHVHHINYDKHCNLPQNLITLCISCHMKTNFDREIWTKHFQSLLSEKYGYKYSENQNIIYYIKFSGGKI